MPFADRVEAGRRLAERLSHLRGPDVVILGLPRGGVPVAFEVAEALGAPLDVIVVRKLGVPFQPELAMGAIGEDGARVLNADVLRAARVGADELAAVEARERAELVRRASRFRGDRPRADLSGRTAVIIDDGIATGATTRAACQVARAHGARRVVLATPVAPASWLAEPHPEADEVVVLEAPEWFTAIGQFYDDFSQTSDDEVLALLARAQPPPTSPASADPGAERAEGSSSGGSAPADGPSQDRAVDAEVPVEAGPVTLEGHLTVPPGAAGVVVFVHGSGSSRHSPRNRYVASVLNEAGLGTLLFDLLTSFEEMDRANVFDIELLADRLVDVTRWLRDRPETRGLPIGYFGASTGGGAALWAAAEPGADIAAVVSRGGRPDLAGPRLADVRAPTLLIVGGNDHAVVELNREAAVRMVCEKRLAIVPGATHLFEEPGALEEVAALATGWFVEHMSDGPAG